MLPVSCLRQPFRGSPQVPRYRNRREGSDGSKPWPFGGQTVGKEPKNGGHDSPAQQSTCARVVLQLCCEGVVLQAGGFGILGVVAVEVATDTSILGWGIGATVAVDGVKGTSITEAKRLSWLWVLYLSGATSVLFFFWRFFVEGRGPDERHEDSHGILGTNAEATVAFAGGFFGEGRGPDQRCEDSHGLLRTSVTEAKCFELTLGAVSLGATGVFSGFLVGEGCGPDARHEDSLGILGTSADATLKGATECEMQFNSADLPGDFGEPISRDEGLDAEVACKIDGILQDKVPQGSVHSIAQGAVQGTVRTGKGRGSQGLKGELQETIMDQALSKTVPETSPETSLEALAQTYASQARGSGDANTGMNEKSMREGSAVAKGGGDVAPATTKRGRRRGRQKHQGEQAVADDGDPLDLCGGCVRKLLMERKASARGMLLQCEEQLEKYTLSRSDRALARRWLEEARALKAKFEKPPAELEGPGLCQGCGCGMEAAGD